MFLQFVVLLFVYHSSMFGGQSQQCNQSIYVNTNKDYEGGNDIHIGCQNDEHGSCKVTTFWSKKFDDEWQDIYLYDSTFHPIVYEGYNLTNRAYGTLIFNTWVRLTINYSKIADTGEWRCRNENGASSVEEQLLIMTKITRDDITINRTTPTIIGYEQTYSCTCTRVFPKFDVEWQITGRIPQAGDTEYNGNSDGSWYMESTLEETLMNASEARLSCTMKYEPDDIIPKMSDPTDIKYVVTHEDIIPSSNTTVNIDDLLEITCVASGSNPILSWNFNDTPIDSGFTEEISEKIGIFTYGQTKANQSKLTWTMDEQEKTCSNINKYNGNYQCFSVVEIGDINTKDSSGAIFISVQHAPILKTKPLTEIVADIGENITLTCEEDCSNPPVRNLIWNSTNGRDDLDEFKNKPRAYIIVREDDYGDEVHCIVDNDIGHAKVSYTFTRVPTTTTAQPEVSPTPDESTTSLSSTNKPGGGDDSRKRDLIIANVVIYTLVAIFSVITALLYRHYRRLKARHEGDDQELMEHKDKSDKANENVEFDNAGAIYEEVPQQHQSIEVVGTQLSDQAKIPSPASTSSTTHLRKRGDIGQTNVRSKEHTAVPEFTPGQNNAQHHTTALTMETLGKKAASPKKTASENPKPIGPKPQISRKPSDRVSHMSSSSHADPAYLDVKLQPVKYDNNVPGQAESQLYANCGVSESPKQDDDKVKYAELNLQEDPYSEGAPDVPVKRFNENETVQYASIKHNT